jgi:hypothetical protein
MRQSRRASFFEAVTNVVVGYFVAVGGQIIIFPFFGMHLKVADNLVIGFMFACVSLIRSYVLRRIFNRIQKV